MSATYPQIDVTKPTGPVADCADQRANWAAANAQLQGLWQTYFIKPVTPPTVSGSITTSDPVLISLIAALASLGLIVDGTTP